MARMSEPCPSAPGEVVPVIDLGRCEGKAACAQVCPYGVFDVRKLTEAEFAAMGWFARLRLKLHGGKQAFAVRADACRACGKCVEACPEDAIRLVRKG